MFAYPLLKHVAKMYAKANLGNVLLLACQHLLEPQEKMFELLLKAGFKPNNCIIIGKNYSANFEIAERLRKKGCIVAPFTNDFDPLIDFDDWFEKKMSEFVSSEMAHRSLGRYRKIIILDDGGMLHLVVNKLSLDFNRVVGIEQTSSGHHKIQKKGLQFPSISVAQSHHKLIFESPFIGLDASERIIDHLKRRGKSSSNILVIGLGPIGRCIAGHLLVVNKHSGYATDIKIEELLHYDVVNFLRASGKLTTTERALAEIGAFDVIVGATGSRVLTSEDLPRLHPEVSLISVSSTDREFPSVPFRHRGGKVHDDYYFEGKCLVNGGFPISFDGSPNGLPPSQIEFTIALLMIRMLDEVGNHPHPVPYVIEQVRSMWQPIQS